MRYGLNKKLYVLKDGESAKPGDSVVEVMTLDMFKKQHHQHMQDLSSCFRAKKCPVFESGTFEPMYYRDFCDSSERGYFK